MTPEETEKFWAERFNRFEAAKSKMEGTMDMPINEEKNEKSKEERVREKISATFDEIGPMAKIFTDELLAHPEIKDAVITLAEEYTDVLVTVCRPLIAEAKRAELEISEARFNTMCSLLAGTKGVDVSDLSDNETKELLLIAFAPRR